MTPFQRGFSLVEIMAVVVIIGIISSFSIGSIRQARSRARDTERKADIVTLAQGVDLYLAEKKVLPSVSPTGCQTYSSTRSSEWNEFSTFIASYIAKQALPIDPVNRGQLRYVYSCDGAMKKYTLKAFLENKNDSDGTPVDPSDPSAGKKYEITR